MKKILVLILLALCVLLASCANKTQYGNWILQETGNPDTMEYVDFPFPITVTIAKDGYVYLQGDLFGEVTNSRQTYAFIQTVAVGDIDDMIEQDGIWEIKTYSDGRTALLIYPYDERIVYRLYRLSDN